MSVRSSSGSRGFYPVAMSPAAQMAIVDHMNSHYRRLQKVKATVDTSPPKAYQLRNSPSPSRQSSRPSSRTSCGSIGSNKTAYAMNREEIIKTTSKINFYMDALQREQRRLLTQVNSTNSHFLRPASASKGSLVDSTRTTATAPLRLRRRQDIIEKHPECFTTENPFTPRVLRSNAKSKLQEYRWYNPPRRKESSGNDVRSVSSMASSIQSQRRSTDRNDSPAESLVDSVEYYEQWLEDQIGPATDIGTESTRNFVDVPYERRSSRQSLRSSIESTVQSLDRLHPVERSAPSTGRNKPIKTMRFENVPNVSKQAADDEELQYLEFVVDVTNDVLTRGIFTNKVLKQVFQSHVEKRQGELSKERMKEAIRQLQTDLGISEENDEESDRASFGYGQIERGGTRNGFRSVTSTSLIGLPSDRPNVCRQAPIHRVRTTSEPQNGMSDEDVAEIHSVVAPRTGAKLNADTWRVENGGERHLEVEEDVASENRHRDTASEAEELSYASEISRIAVGIIEGGSVVGSVEDDFAELSIGDNDDIFDENGES